MSELSVYIEVWCPECDGDDVEILDYDDFVLLCRCQSCKLVFEENRW